MNQIEQGRSLRAFAKAYDLSISTVYREIRRGRLEVHKVGKKGIITSSSEARWLESLPRLKKQGRFLRVA